MAIWKWPRLSRHRWKNRKWSWVLLGWTSIWMLILRSWFLSYGRRSRRLENKHRRTRIHVRRYSISQVITMCSSCRCWVLARSLSEHQTTSTRSRSRIHQSHKASSTNWHTFIGLSRSMARSSAAWRSSARSKPSVHRSISSMTQTSKKSKTINKTRTSSRFSCWNWTTTHKNRPIQLRWLLWLKARAMHICSHKDRPIYGCQKNKNSCL